MSDRTAVVVGAGIGGLTAALALKRAGWQVRVLERHAQASELGFALMVAPNAMCSLRELGLSQTVREAGFMPVWGEMRRPDGRVLRRIDTTPVQAALGEPAIVALRPVLHGALLDAVGRDTITLNARCTGIELAPNGAHAALDDGSKLFGHVVIGADGIGSVVRKALHPNEPPPRRSGLFALRGVAENVAQHLGDVSGAQYLGRGIEAGAARANQTAVYWFLSLTERYVPDPAEAPRALLERIAAGFHAPFRDIVLATQPHALRLDDLVVRDPLPHWGEGHVTLLGDAAHPMLPHAGQGAAQAIEDGLALARALSDSDPEAGLRRYECQRMPRTQRIVKLAAMNARVTALSNPLACWARDTAISLVPTKALLQRMIDVGKPPTDAA